MSITSNETGHVCITGNGIDLYQVMMLHSALKLEVKTGMRMWRERSAYSVVKERFGLHGKKEKVLEQFTKIVEEARANYKND